MNSILLKCENAVKKYNGKVIFKNVTLELTSGSSLVVTGKNGSGKSTLLKVICNLVRLDKGKIELTYNGSILPTGEQYRRTGLLAPYLNLYDELTAYENLRFFGKLNGNGKERDEHINFLLEKVGLYKRRNDLMRNFSSGMKQRLKLAFAVQKDPGLLLLDEPRTNLDVEGIDVVYKIAEEQKQKGILIIATNEKEDASLCSQTLNIEDYK